MTNVSSSNSQGELVPKLRFPGFEGEPYHSETVGALFDHASRRNSDGSNGNVITNSAEHGLIPQRDFFDKDIAVEGNTSNYYIIKKGDFVYNPRKSTTAPYGPFNCYRLEDEGIVSPLYTCLTPKHEEFTEFLLWYFKSPAWYSYIYHNGAQGGARHDRVGMTNELMDGIPVNLPCIKEQDKISAFLSTLDRRIDAQRKLVDTLKLYKRGALNTIFGDNAPSGWTTEQLSGVTTSMLDGDWIESKDQSESGIRLIQTGNIGTGFFSEKNDRAKYVSDETFLRLHCTEVFPGDILVSRLPAPAGRACIVPIRNERMITAVDCTIIRANTDYVHPNFLLQFLNSEAYFKTIDSFLAGGTRQRVSRKNLESVKIWYPSISDQQNISANLGKIDELIFAQIRIGECLEKMKSGLLQQLFI